MRKSWASAALLIGGIGLGAAITIYLVKTWGSSCPLCGGKLETENGPVYCKSCGVELKVREPRG